MLTYLDINKYLFNSIKPLYVIFLQSCFPFPLSALIVCNLISMQWYVPRTWYAVSLNTTNIGYSVCQHILSRLQYLLWHCIHLLWHCIRHTYIIWVTSSTQWEASIQVWTHICNLRLSLRKLIGQEPTKKLFLTFYGSLCDDIEKHSASPLIEALLVMHSNCWKGRKSKIPAFQKVFNWRYNEAIEIHCPYWATEVLTL